MRCYICDRPIHTPNYNKDHKDYDPCDVCMEVINDLVKGDVDRPYADEDDFTDGPDILQMYWPKPEEFEDD